MSKRSLRKLVLERETLRALNAREMRRVDGGCPPGMPDTVANVTCVGCDRTCFGYTCGGGYDCVLCP